MDAADISIVIVAISIALSAMVINLFKNKNFRKVIFEKDEKSLMFFRLLNPFILISVVVIHFLYNERSLEGNNILFGVAWLLVLLGLLTRWLAIYQLGAAFVVKVSIINNQELITNRLYKYIRHPSYTGIILYFTGLGIFTANVYIVAYILFLIIIPILVRIKVEEKVLIQHFGEKYVVYTKKSKKLFPFIY